jgi:hypothetical protein
LSNEVIVILGVGSGMIRLHWGGAGKRTLDRII